MSDKFKQAAQKIKRWRENPCQFVFDNFQVTLDQWQIDTLNLLSGSNSNKRRRVVMKACTGPGKTMVLAFAGWHRLSCFGEKSRHPKGVAISGEGKDNLRDNLWAELSKWRERSEYLKAAFECHKEKAFAKDHEQTWFLSARSYAKDADSEAIGRSISGLHSEYPFILLDEIGDAPVAIGQKASQIFTGGCEDGLVIAAGNPTSTSGLLYHVSTIEREQWDVVTITADPDDPKRTPRVPIEHAREQINLYGRDNPWVMATILGLFPPSSLNTLLSPDEVEKAMTRHLREEEYNFAQKRLGIDVARFGDDRTVIFPRQGLASFRPVELRMARTTDIAARVMLAKKNWNSEMEFVDDSGHWGHGVIDNLIAAGFSPQAVLFEAPPIDRRYKNKRAEMWLSMAEWVKRGGALPNIPGLQKELTTPTYTFANGSLQLEPKDRIKARLGKSPDLADALCLTFALPDMPASLQLPYGFQKPKVETDYDPFDESRL